MTSATIASPLELAERLVGTEFELIDSDGAPKASRRIAMWNPPLTDRASGAAARSSPRRPTCSPTSSPRARGRSASSAAAAASS
ncbi:MAG: hypothetical protein R2700_10240 [Solirubrobacterales bacterium]